LGAGFFLVALEARVQNNSNQEHNASSAESNVGEQKVRISRTAAAELCAVIFNFGKPADQYSIAMDKLAVVMRLRSNKTNAISSSAIERGWVRRHGEVVQLTAAGIYVAKRVLHLSR
jgi:hypothetical protein